MKHIFYPSAERGKVDLGWLNSHHSFSFGHWYDPQKMNFGALRVLNDDIVKGGGGFGAHPHDNMEIVSIPMDGRLAHKDSMGTDGIIRTGDVQIMSAGTGIRHSEYNASETDPVNFLQIWVIPKVENIKPRYEQKTFAENERLNQWQVLVSPDKKEGGVWINQDSRFLRTKLQSGKQIKFETKIDDSGVYVFVLDGEIQVEQMTIAKKDAIGIYDAKSFMISAKSEADILAIEVPVNLS